MVLLLLGGSYAIADSESPIWAQSIRLSHVFFEARGGPQENQTSRFQMLGQLGVEGKFAPWLEMDISVGTQNMFFAPNWVTAPSEQLLIHEFQGTFKTFMGDFYAGQFKVPFGFGNISEDKLWFPRTLFYEQGLLPLFDQGMGFRVARPDVFMDLAVHTGEAGLGTSDDRYFTTGQWGYRGGANSRMGVSLSTGNVLLGTTQTKHSLANVFFGFDIGGLGLQAQATRGRLKTSTTESNFIFWNIDVQHPLSDSVNLIGRYEQYDPTLNNSSGTLLGRTYLGLEVHTQYRMARLFLYFVKNTERDQEVPNDEAFVAFRMAP